MGQSIISSSLKLSITLISTFIAVALVIVEIRAKTQRDWSGLVRCDSPPGAPQVRKLRLIQNKRMFLQTRRKVSLSIFSSPSLQNSTISSNSSSLHFSPIALAIFRKPSFLQSVHIFRFDVRVCTACCKYSYFHAQTTTHVHEQECLEYGAAAARARKGKTVRGGP